METDSVIIKSSDNNAEVEFSDREGLFRADGSEYYRVTFKTNELTASTRIYAFHPYGEFCWQYFERLAKNWRGWNGTKQWSSLEGEFKISSESDSLGHTTMEITLVESYGIWKAQVTLVFDAVQLDDIALKIKTFFAK